jgi:hypothetical protein
MRTYLSVIDDLGTAAAARRFDDNAASGFVGDGGEENVENRLRG